MSQPNDVPPGYCHCGCGGKAPLAQQTHTAKGYVKGEPVRFIAGHQTRGVRRPLAERFWEKVATRGPDECWPWTGARTPHGYGVFNLGAREGLTYAHRFSYELEHGPIPESEGYHGVCVLHTCDNPPCCNPAHLFAGTHADNMEDMEIKGRARGARGQRHRSAKLTPDQVREIRVLLAAGVPQTEAARRYAVNPGTVNNIKSGRTWAHLD